MPKLQVFEKLRDAEWFLTNTIFGAEREKSGFKEAELSGPIQSERRPQKVRHVVAHLTNEEGKTRMEGIQVQFWRHPMDKKRLMKNITNLNE